MVEIFNLRGSDSDAASSSSSSSASSLRRSILAGLAGTQEIVPGSSSADKRWAYSKEIPTVVLYDDKGLDIYNNEITACEQYYLYGSELAILRKHGNDIAKRLFSVANDSLADEVPALSLSDNDSSSDGDQSPERDSDQEDPADSGYQSLKSSFPTKEKCVNGNLGLDESVAKSTGSVVELGAGSLKKTSLLLRGLANSLKEGAMDSITYYALDLEHGQLDLTLNELEKSEGRVVTSQSRQSPARGRDSSPGRNSKVVVKGICASYEDAFPYLKEGKLDADGSVHSPEEKKCILFLGSSIGNDSREDATAFLRKISDEAMSAGDTMLIGIDACNDVDLIEKAYHDDDGCTERFILNGITHVDRILGGVGLKAQDFAYVSRYTQEAGRHEAYVSPKHDIQFECDEQKVSLKKGELIRIERSYKYTVQEAQRLFASAGLRLVQKWTDDDKTGSYHLYLLEKPLFHFSSVAEKIKQGVNPFGLPTLDEWEMLWKAWDCVTLSMIPRDLLHSKPIDLRHICLFYLGHIPGFLDIHMSRYLKEPYTEPSHYPDMFERGIDPNMDDPSKVHAHSVVPTEMEDWPTVDEIVAYRDRVRARLLKLYSERLDEKKGPIDTRLVRTMQMVHEHEAMHLETLLYMCAQITPGKLNSAPGFSIPDWSALSDAWNKQVASEQRATGNLIRSYPTASVVIGHDDFEDADSTQKYDPAHTFGWDNESPRRQVEVPAFRVSLLPISNEEYLRFFEKQGAPSELVPGSWIRLDDGTFGVRVLASPGFVTMDVARHWPCMAAGKQLAAYASSVGGRLPTEPELRRFIVDNPVDHVGANIGFANWHPVPARLPLKLRDGTESGASNGGVWEWTSTDFAAWEGFIQSKMYPGYSADFFDGCHSIMLGGSFATIPRIAGRGIFTNWYQGSYPYVFAGARVAYDA